MSDRLSLGNYSLEITDREVVVRDQRGNILETVRLDALNGNLMLPDGHQVDVAALLADADRGLTDLTTAAGPTGTGNFGPAGANTPGSFRAFSDSADQFVARQGAGTLGNTSLQYGTIDGDPKPADEKETLAADGMSAIAFAWSSHDQWQMPENQSGGELGRMLDGDPQDFTFQVSDPRFEVVDGILQLKAGESFDHESEPYVDLVVTATSRSGETQSQPVRVDILDRNEAQTDIGLDNMTVQENVPGAVIGTLTVVDPDAGDSQTFAVSDNRFEVVDGQLKLRDGIALDFESEPLVNVTVTATDQGGHSISEQFTIGVGDVNEAQTALSLDGAYVAENAAGAVIGNLTVVDPDAGDSQTFAVSDSRFEVVDGQLKLKDGVALDFESEPVVNVTVTATDQGGHSISEQFTIGVGDVNEAQTAMSIDHHQVAENAAGAVVGNLTVIDPDAGDSQTFTVSDSRFEVVDNQLKLKSGVSLNYEAEPSVDVTVTATDKAGHEISQIVTVNVTDVNEAPTAILLSNATVAENAPGAAIGQLTTVDPDAGDTFSYQVSDSRFQVVNGQLQLKSGIAFDYETEPSVSLKVTSTDSAGHSIQQSFTVTVANVNEAPVVTVKDGSAETHIVNTSTAYNPSADATVGAYLYSNDSAGVKVPSASLLNGVAASNMTLTAPTTVTVTFQKEAAGNRNMVGTYQYDDKGNIIPGSVKFIWLDASATTEGKLGSTMVKDFLGYAQSNTVSLGAMAAGTHVGFFTVSNGAADSTNTKLLGNAAAGAANQAAAMDAIASQLSIKVDANGNGHVYVGNSQMNGDVFFSHDKTLNTDFNGGKDIDHMASGVSSSSSGQLLIGVEDLNGGGDRDYNDVVFSVNLGTYNVVKTTQSVVQPSVDFSDIDSHALSQAVIHSSGFQSGDALNVPASGLFNVNVAHSGNDVTITITGKTGGETVDQYESFVNSITFSTSSKAEGDRNIDYSIVDEGGLTSNVGHAHIGIANSYEISSSQLAANQNALGSGDDHLYLNSGLAGHLDFGTGHDTLHLARNNDSLGHSDFAKLDNVEAIDMTGFGGNKVALSIVDVLDMTDADHRLTVVGDKGDVVTLSGDGSGHHWQVVDSGDEFTTYAWSDPVHQAVVEISNQLTAQIG